jgi:hypothetical protein
MHGGDTDAVLAYLAGQIEVGYTKVSYGELFGRPNSDIFHFAAVITDARM